MIKKSEWIKHGLIIYIFLLVFCFTFYFLFSYCSFILDKTISLLDLINILIVLGMALYVPMFLHKFIDVKRTEQDMLIKFVEKFESEIEGLLSFIDSKYTDGDILLGKVYASRLVMQVRKVSNTLNRIKELLGEYEDDKRISENRRKLLNCQRKLFESLTYDLAGNEPKITEINYNNSQKIIQEYLTNIMNLKLSLNSY